MVLNLRGLLFKSLLVVAIVIALFWAAFSAKILSATVTAIWSYDYGPQPPCSASKTADCIDHFEVGDLSDEQTFVFICSTANPIPAVGKIRSISTTFKYGPPFGNRTISVIAVGKDAKGDRVTSNPFAARVTAKILPGSKTAAIF